MKKIGVIGAGFSGAVVAHQLARAGYEVTVFEKRAHVAGNCHTERDLDTGVMVHSYGPHIFHTDDHNVWDFMRGFGEMMPYTNRVKAVTKGRVYSLPVNLLTINQFFGKVLRPAEARRFVESLADKSVGEPRSFEEQALRFVGKELYEAFFLGYTLKQWGVHPRDLPASILRRLPVRFTYDDNYFNHRYQGIPREGYTRLIERMLSVTGVTVVTGVDLKPRERNGFDHWFYSGPLDAWFEYVAGRLPYRTLGFEQFVESGDYQGNAVMNFCEQEVPFTRITEHKFFAPWETHEKTFCSLEYSRSCGIGDIPYYPIRFVQGSPQLKTYVDLAAGERGVTFIGRLGTYRYLDMDVTIRQALDTAETFLECERSGAVMPAFVFDPMAG